jgi:hypothetical protein
MICALFAAMGLALAGPSSGQAQDAAQESGEVSTSSSSGGSYGASARGPLRVYGGFHFGGGGHVRTKVDTNGASFSHKDGMAGLIGFQGGLEYVLHRYFSLGYEMRFTSTKASNQNGGDRTLLWDFLTVKPKGRYEFSNIPLEVYGTLPVGIDLFAPRNGVDKRVNANFGFGGGATYFFTEKMGANFEILGLWHWWHKDDVKLRVGQPYFFLNFVYAL